MKKKLLIFGLFSLVVLLGVIVASNIVDAGKGEKAIVSAIDGKVFKAAKKSGPWKELKQGSELSVDDYLKTEKDAKVELSLPDESKLRIAENSLVKMKSLMVGAGKKLEVDLEGGKVWAKVKKAVGGEEKFEVKTENAVAGVRGTIFRVDYREDKATVVKVYSGAVAVNNKPSYAKVEDIKSGKKTQVAGPKQISKKEWEEKIAKDLQAITVLADGSMEKPVEFAEADEKEDPWVKWNKELDSAEN